MTGGGDSRRSADKIVGDLLDAASKLPENLRLALPDVPWDEIRANRVFVAHIYHRIDYEVLWSTLVEDVPGVADALARWHDQQ